MRCSRRETRAQTVPDDGRSSRQISPAPTMGGDGDGERQDGDRKVELDEDTKKMLEDFIGAPIDDMTHPFWNPPPLTEEEEAIFEDVKRRAKECIGLDGFTEDLLLKDMHVQYVKRSSEDKDAIEYVLTDHLRLSGMYWGLTALDLLGRLDVVDADEIVDFVQRCWVPEVGGTRRACTTTRTSSTPSARCRSSRSSTAWS